MLTQIHQEHCHGTSHHSTAAGNHTQLKFITTGSTDDWDFGTPIQFPILKYSDSDVFVAWSRDRLEKPANINHWC